MKKYLLGTTAFAAASVAATGAMAQSLEDRIRTLEESMLMGSPGSGFDVSVSGSAHGGVFFLDIDHEAGTDQDYANVDVKVGSTEVHFTATGHLDDGIEVGGRVELEGFTTGDQIDETYIWTEGGFGRMVIGAENGPSYLMHYSAPWYAGVNGVDSPNYRYTVAQAARTNTQTLIASDANKITYFTPRFSGFQFGLSFTPDNSDRNGEQNGWGSAYDRSSGTAVENIVALAGNFSRDFGSVSFGASAGWESGSSSVVGDFDGDDSTPDTGVEEDPVNWHIGSEVSKGGFTLGGAYYRAEGFNQSDGSVSILSLSNYGDGVAFDLGGERLLLAGSADSQIRVTDYHPTATAYDVSKDIEQIAWAVGASYGAGPWNIGIAYLQSEWKLSVLNSNAAGETSVVGIGASYQAAPGVLVATDMGFYKDNTHLNNVGSDFEAFGAGLILGISF